MDCPRCGTRLTRISLDGELQSVYCERCRFADVESDHTRASEGEETWDDALRRFRTAGAEDADGESAEDADSDSDRDDGTAEDDEAAPGGDAEAEEA